MAFNIQSAGVIWKWNCAYRGMGGKAETFMNAFVEDIRSSDLPGTSIQVTQLKVGLIFGARREYTEVSAAHLLNFRIFVSARPYGKHLAVSAYLACATVLGYAGNLQFDTFQLQDLGDYLASAQISISYALSQVAKEAGLDPQQIKAEFQELALPGLKK